MSNCGKMRLILIICWITAVRGFTVYDCSTPDPQGIFSLSPAERCDSEGPGPFSEKEVSGSLLQVPYYYEIPATLVQVQRLREEVYCTYTGLRTKLIKPSSYRGFSTIKIPGGMAEDWVATGTVRYSGTVMDLPVGAEKTFMDAEQIDDKGFCKVWKTNTWVDQYKVSAAAGLLKVHLTASGESTSITLFDEIISGPIERGHGYAPDGAVVVWDTKDVRECAWELLYSGPIMVVSDPSGKEVALFPSLSSAITLTTASHFCTKEVRDTSDSRLRVTVGHTVEAARVSARSLASWATTIRTAIEYESTSRVLDQTSKIRSLMADMCILEQKLHRDIVYSASTSPELVGFRLTGQLGTAVVVAGGAVQVLRCEGQEAQLRTEDHCSDMIPIHLVKANMSAYMDPVTYVIKPSSSRMDCSDIQVPYFSIRGAWYRLLPHKTTVPAPSSFPSSLSKAMDASLSTYKGLYPDEVVDGTIDQWRAHATRASITNGLINLGDSAYGDPTTNPSRAIVETVSAALDLSALASRAVLPALSVTVACWMGILTVLVLRLYWAHWKAAAVRRQARDGGILLRPREEV